MKLNENVASALNDQVNSEWNAAYTYLAISAYFDAQDLPGFAGWFRAHAQEEMTHAQKIYDFMVARDSDVTFEGIAKPTASYASPIAAIEASLAHEQAVTAQINALFELASTAKEYSTQTMLNWFVTEQVEEEDVFRDMLRKVTAAAGDRWNMLTLDSELASGSPTE